MNGLTCFKAPTPEKIFFEMLSICLDLERVWSIRPSDYEESTLLISWPSICAWIETSAWVCSLLREPVIMNSVLSTFRLSLLSHLCIIGKVMDKLENL